MTTYSTIITNNGKAMFASAATSSGRVNITHLAVGDGNGSVPTPKAIQTRLIKEAHRVTVNSVERHATNANWIEIGAIIPSSSGGYTVREIGLYAGNTLIAVGSFPATYKPTASEGGAREMSIRIIIAVENAAVVNVTLDNSLVYATRQWVESNFVNHNEVIDNLTSTDTDKPLSANQGKVLKDGLDGLTTSKADKTTNLTAGNGLTGGGNLSASRTVALGTPSQITASTTNSVTATSHTHAIDKASTTVAGVVQLVDNLTTDDATKALTARQGKVLKDGLDGLTTSKADKTTNLTAGNGLTGGGNLSASRTVALGTPSQITASTTNSVTATSHTHAIDKASTTVAGVVQLVDNLTTDDATKALTARQGKVLKDGLDGLTTSKADKTTNLTAGNGLTGGGNLSASRTVALGTPSQITASTTNSVTATSHTHAIDKASTTVAGVVQLVDNLTTDDATKALTARQGKVLKDGLDGLTTSKADKTTNLTAGNGLTGGGNLSASRTVALGTPSQITASTTNSVTATSHTHAIDKASTTVAGVVQLVDNLTTDDATKALTARQGKVLNDKIDNKDSLKTINYLSDKSSNYELTGFYRSNAIMMGSNPLPAMEMHITHPAFSGNSYARGIGFTYGGSFDLTTTAWDAQGVYLGQKTILTELNGVMLSDKSNSIELDDAGKVATSKAVYTLNQAKLDKTANAVSASKLQTARTIGGVAFDGTTNINLPGVNAAGNQNTSGNAATATKLANARTISLTGAVTGSVSFNGTANVNIATTLNLADFANSKTKNGYQKLPNGLIIQWGDKNNYDPVVFPIAFPNNVLNVSLTLKVNSSDSDGKEVFGVHSVTNKGFSIFSWVYPSQGCYWIAIGY